MQALLNTLGFSAGQLAFVLAAAFVAGMVRGFAGFGLSAVLMASVVSLVPPVALIPVCYLLEATASFAMFRGGMRNADMRMVWGLMVGSMMGVPIGLYATNLMDPDTSKLVALLLVLALTAAQMLGLELRFLQSRFGSVLCGVLAGMATGLAGVGGMVVALYVLASSASAKSIRGSLVMFLFLGVFSSALYLWAYGMWTTTAVKQALTLAPFMLLGVALGSFLFKPDNEKFYKRACQGLLIVLCGVGLVRQLYG